MIRTNPFNKVPNEESQLHSQSIPPKKNYALNQNKNTFDTINVIKTEVDTLSRWNTFRNRNVKTRE